MENCVEVWGSNAEPERAEDSVSEPKTIDSIRIKGIVTKMT